MPYRIDHRSYIEQGIHRQPTLHMGKEAAALERKGVSTEKGNYNRTVAACNEMAELGIEPTGLWETAQAIFEQAKAPEGRPQRPEVAQSGGQSGRSVRSQDAKGALMHRYTVLCDRGHPVPHPRLLCAG
ncbi:MAG: conjugal transfer protein TraA [Oscillospiraceae bacterium]|nr:conjugal transfer protein TraA [Oscillospiraceae bacterium]